MKNYRLIIGISILAVIIASIGFYYVITNREDADFKENIVMPDGIAIFDKEIYDEVVAKTIVMEIQNSPNEKATKKDLSSINEDDRAFSIRALYNAEAPKSGQLEAIEVLKDGTFVASKKVNGKSQYAKGRFGIYTLDYLTGLYTLE